VCYGVSIVQQFFISLIYMLFDTLKSLIHEVIPVNVGTHDDVYRK
jgi:hypothetical protein